MTLSVVDIGGVKLFDTTLFMKDCSFPITDMRRKAAPDDVLNNMPVFLGYWANGLNAPAITNHTMDIQTDAVVSDPNCGIGTVKGDIEDCYLTVPNMKDIALASEGLNVRELIERYCKTRNVSEENAATIIDAQGQLDMGSPYAFDFARFAAAQVSLAMQQLLAHSVMVGDASNNYQVDGFYNQLENGWAKPSDNCPDSLNLAQSLDWGAVTGAVGDAHPDDVTEEGQTVTWWGQTYDVPAGLNLAQFLDTFWIPAVRAWWTDNMGGNVIWEMHVSTMKRNAFLRSAACIQPCNVSGDFDPALRERLQRFISVGIAEMLETKTAFPVLESPHVPADEMWFGPRSINSKPTYGVFFEDIANYARMLGDAGRLYNAQYGLPADDPLVKAMTTLLKSNFESVAFQRYWNFQNILCATVEMLTNHGVIVAGRHLWLHITNVTSLTAYTAPSATLTIEGAALPVYS